MILTFLVATASGVFPNSILLLSNPEARIVSLKQSDHASPLLKTLQLTVLTMGIKAPLPTLELTEIV